MGGGGIWLPSGGHVVPMWLPPGGNVVAMWWEFGGHMVATWCRCGCHLVADLVAAWSRCGGTVVTLRSGVAAQAWRRPGRLAVAMWWRSHVSVENMFSHQQETN